MAWQTQTQLDALQVKSTISTEIFWACPSTKISIVIGSITVKMKCEGCDNNGNCSKQIKE